MPTAGADVTWPGTLDVFSQPDGTVDFEDGAKHHAKLHRQYAQVVGYLEQLAQSGEYDYGLIYLPSGQVVARNERNASQEFGPGTYRSVHTSVMSALAARGPTSGGFQTPGGRVWYGTTRAANDVIPVDGPLPLASGVHLRGAGYARRGISGVADINPILQATGFTSGAVPMFDATTGTDGLENVVLDGVSLDAGDQAECAIRAMGVGTANAMSLWRCAFQGGTKEVVRLGDTGFGASTDIWMSDCLIHHNKPKVGVTERALMTALGGDVMAFANTYACPQGNAVGVLLNAAVAGHALALSDFYSKIGTDGNGFAGVKLVASAMAILDFLDFIGHTQVQGGLWVAPGSSNALKVPHAAHLTFRPGAAQPLVYLDGGGAGSGFGAAMLRLHGITSPGAGAAGQIPAVVRFARNWDAGSAVRLESMDVLNAAKAFDNDGTTAAAPSNTWGNMVAAGDTFPLGSVLSEQWIVTTVTIGAGGGDSANISHGLYASADIVEVTVMGATPANGRLSGRATGAGTVKVTSTAAETSLKVAIFVKVTGS